MPSKLTDYFDEQEKYFSNRQREKFLESRTKKPIEKKKFESKPRLKRTLPRHLSLAEHYALKTIKLKLWKANKHCTYCRKNIDYHTSTIDHLKPKAHGGTNEESNLMLSCYDCNHTKGDMSPHEWAIVLLSKYGWTRNTLAQYNHFGLAVRSGQ